MPNKLVFGLLGLMLLLSFADTLSAQRVKVGDASAVEKLFGKREPSARNMYADWQKVNIPFEYVNDFIVLDVTLNNFFKLKFIFDTGAEHTILTKRSITDILGVPYVRRFTLMGADMSTELHAYLARGLHISLGTVQANNQAILVLEEDYFQFEEFMGMKVHGIMGANFFRGYQVRLNYQRQVITLYRPNGFNPGKDRYQELDIEIYRSKPYLQADLEVQKDSTLPVKLLIDTGASLSLLLYTDTDPNLEPPPTVIPSNVGKGLGGYLEGYLGRVDELNFADFKMANIITNFQDTIIYRDSSLMNNRNGIMGNKVLSRFDIVIDYWNEKLYMRPNKHYDDAFKYDRSGLLIIASGPNLSTYTVQSVIPGSPAAEAGLQKGDVLKTLNWIPVTLYSLENINHILQKKVGKRIRLIIKRDGERMKKVFYLDNYI